MNEKQEQKLLAATKVDMEYRRLLAECQELEDAYTQIKDNLSEEDRELLERYIALCEELEYRRTCLAMEMSGV